MIDTTEGFEFTEEGTMNAYFGVEISPFPDGKGFTFSQPFFIDRIIQSLGFDPNTTKDATNNTPAGYLLLKNMKMFLTLKHLGNTVISSACLDICKEQQFLTLQW